MIGVVRPAVAKLGPLGIRSNTIGAGGVMTPVMASAFGVPKEKSDESGASETSPKLRHFSRAMLRNS